MKWHIKRLSAICDLLALALKDNRIRHNRRLAAREIRRLPTSLQVDLDYPALVSGLIVRDRSQKLTTDIKSIHFSDGK